jgi:cell division septum initiation protein DivIVA
MVWRAGSDRASAEGSTGSADALGLPNVKGDLGELMDHRPAFRSRMQGYDRLEVDNYTAWAEGELIAVRREVDHLLSRFAECSAELEISRRLLADAPPGREAFPVSQRVREMLRLAEDEAAAITDAGAHEAEHVLAEARTEADARLRKAHEIKDKAVNAADEILEQARRHRGAAVEAVERARTEAAGILREAAAERERLAVAAAQERERLAVQAAQEREKAAAVAAAQLAAVQAKVDQLWRQRDQARQSLRALTDRIGEALHAVAAMVPEDLPGTNVTGTNVAVEGMVRDDRDEPNVAVEGMVRDDRDEPNVVTVDRPAPAPH